jgi:succinate dehydrogenase / fumarate reductase cytochrome b subunit
MGRVRRLAKTSIGSKAIVAVTGALLFLFLIAHLIGNLQVFLGPEALNGYAKFLHSKPFWVWAFRIGMLAIVTIHVWFTIVLKLENWEARPDRYRKEATLKASVASRYMIWTGLLVGAFIVFHILHFTAHVVDTGGMAVDPELGMTNVYDMVITGFSVPWVAFSYLVAMILLGFHLYHATSSLFQTLGWNHATINPIVRWMMPLLGILIVVGNCVIVGAIYLGWVG